MLPPSKLNDVLRYDLQAKLANSSDMYRTTYHDTLEANLQEKTGYQQLNPTTIHRGKEPPAALPNSHVRWDNKRNDWVRAPNIKLNFVTDTWGSQWSIEHANSIDAEERFSPSSKTIGSKVFENLRVDGPAGHTALDDLELPTKSTSPLRNKKTRSLSAPRNRNAGSPRSPRGPHMLSSTGRTWGGIPVESLLRDSNPNNYGRWNRTASNVNETAFQQFPHPSAMPPSSSPYVTSKQLENAAIEELFCKQGKWKRGYNHDRYCANRWTSVSAETPPWMKIGGVRVMPPQ